MAGESDSTRVAPVAGEAVLAPPVSGDSASAAEAVKAEDAKPARSRGMAMGGQTASIPEMPPTPSWPDSAGPDDDYVPDEQFDAQDLSAVNRELNRCRARIFRISQALRVAQRNAGDADLTYRRHMRRALVSISGGSAETRKAMAELQCEQYENDLVVAQQIVEELKKRSTDARDDLKAVENLSHNVRAQMDIR